MSERFFYMLVTVVFTVSGLHAQSYSPTELNFKKDYQVRIHLTGAFLNNFYEMLQESALTAPISLRLRAIQREWTHEDVD